MYMYIYVSVCVFITCLRMYSKLLPANTHTNLANEILAEPPPSTRLR